MDSPRAKTEENDGLSAMLMEPTTKPHFKSFRKKYRKMKIRFDAGMDEASELFNAEHRARKIAQRIQEQNDQLLEILLELNDSKETPPTTRYDLHSPNIGLARPDLTPNSNVDGEKMQPANSLPELESTTTHTAAQLASPSVLPIDLQEHDMGQPGYLTPVQEERLIARIDDSLQTMDPLYKTSVLDLLPTELNHMKSAWPHELSHDPNEPDFALDNPVSVHNWLRVNHPEIYEIPAGKDKDSEVGDIKPPARSGRSRKGKDIKLSKQDIPYKDLDEEIDFDVRMEEEGGTVAVSGAGIGGASGSSRSRKKKDDETYRPKGGHSKSTKRKRDKDDGGGESKSGKRVKKVEDD